MPLNPDQMLLESWQTVEFLLKPYAALFLMQMQLSALTKECVGFFLAFDSSNSVACHRQDLSLKV